MSVILLNFLRSGLQSRAVRVMPAGAQAVRFMSNDGQSSDDESRRELSKVEICGAGEPYVMKASFTVFKGKPYVDIRRYSATFTGDVYPTKKGISMTVDEWRALVDKMEDIDKQVNELVELAADGS